MKKLITASVNTKDEIFICNDGNYHTVSEGIILPTNFWKRLDDNVKEIITESGAPRGEFDSGILLSVELLNAISNKEDIEDLESAHVLPITQSSVIKYIEEF